MSLSLQATETVLQNQVERLTDQCTRLDASLREASHETQELRVKLLERQPLKFASNSSPPLLDSLQQRLTANKVCACAYAVLFYHVFSLLEAARNNSSGRTYVSPDVFSFFSTPNLRGPSADCRETLQYDRKLAQF